MVLQTWLIFTDSYAFFCDRKAASSWLVKLLDDLQNGVHAANMGVWPKESPHLFIDMASLENAREILVCHTYRRICFPVFQQNIISGIILFYKAIFKQKCIFFRIDNRIWNVENLRNEYFCFVSIYFFVEVWRYASFQILGLSYVYNRMVFILILIAARFLRHAQYNILKSCESFLIFLLGHIPIPLFIGV